MRLSITSVGCLILPAILQGQLSKPLASGEVERTALLQAKSETSPPAFTTDALRHLDNSPLAFEPNQGQAEPEVVFLARASGYTLALTHTEMRLNLPRVPNPTSNASKDLLLRRAIFPDKPVRDTRQPGPMVRMRFVAGNPAADIQGLDQQIGISNYFLGNDPKQWRHNVPRYRKLRYRNVYPGVDLVYYGNASDVEFDFIVAPGADPSIIAMDFQGATKLSINNRGDLVLDTASGPVRMRKPQLYQEQNGAAQSIRGDYVLRSQHRVAFAVSPYDSTRPLTIDPTLSYFTTFGVNQAGYGVAVDSAGNAYVTGTVFSFDAYVSKLDPSGALLYTTVFGGSGREDAIALALDTSGNPHVTGYTASSNFPLVNPLFSTPTGSDNFLTVLNAEGSITYSSYLGAGLGAQGIAIDPSNNQYIAGSVSSAQNFPVTPGAYQSVSNGSQDAFALKLNPSGSALIYSTFLGGTGFDEARGIAVDSSGNAYISGRTESTDFPTVNAIQGANNGNGDAYVTKLNPSGSALIYSTYVGGSGLDTAVGIAADSSGSAYVVGTSTSSNFPTKNPLQGQNLGLYDAFILKIGSAGTLVYSTYLGGNDIDFAFGVVLDSFNRPYVAGYTSSSNFRTVEPVQPTLRGPVDVFVAQLDATGSVLQFSTFLGTDLVDYSGFAQTIALDRLGNVYVAGWGGVSSVFLAKISGLTASTGTIKISTNLDAAKFTISGPATFTGTGKAFTKTDAPVGAYSITYEAVAGYATPPSESKTLVAGSSIDFVGSYQVPLPLITIFPSQITFPPTRLNTRSSPITITISNSGTGVLDISDLATQNPFAILVAIGSPFPSLSIPPNGKSTIDLIFTPPGPGPFSGTLTISSNASNTPVLRLPLNGTVQPDLVLLYTNDIHGLWNKHLESGSTLIQTIGAKAAEERALLPGRVLLVDAGDIVSALGDSVLPVNDGNGGTTNYYTYLKAMQRAGYDAVTIGNHDCCLGNHNAGFDWNNPFALSTAISDTQATGLQVLSANIRALSETQCDPTSDSICASNIAWLPYERQVEKYLIRTIGGVRVGIFGLTAPLTYGAKPPIYGDPSTSPFSTLLSETQMRATSTSVVQNLRSTVDVLIALTHIDFDGLLFQSNPATGCLQLGQPQTAIVPRQMGLPVDIAICGHDHALERLKVIPDRGDGRPFLAAEAGSSQACTSDNPFSKEKDCTTLLPRPRLGRLKLAVADGKVVPILLDFIELAPRYEASYEGQTPSGDAVIQLAQGNTLALQARFKNVGTRTWFKNAFNSNAPVVRLVTLDPRTGSPNFLLPFVYGTGNQVRPADLLEDIVAPGSVGTFNIRLSVGAATKPGAYTIRVAPVADAQTEAADVMHDGVSTIAWKIVVVGK